ncbi:MAG: hypothetical protein ACI362_02840 [Coriobacteriales bacterium]
MRYEHMHFHHFPGHGHAHGHHYDHAAEPVRTKEQTIQLLEYLCHHNEEHAAELAGYHDEIDEQAASGLLAESVMFLNRSNAKLNDAIAALKRSN